MAALHSCAFPPTLLPDAPVLHSCQDAWPCVVRAGSAFVSEQLGGRAFPASIVAMVLGLEEDDLRFQPQDPRQQRLLIVRQLTALLALNRKFLLQRPNSPHEVLRAKAL
jgi:hypothetical protein